MRNYTKKMPKGLQDFLKEKSPDEIADDIFDVVFKDKTNGEKQIILCQRIAHAIRSEREKAEGNLKCVTDYSKHLKEQIAELQRQVEEAHLKDENLQALIRLYKSEAEEAKEELADWRNGYNRIKSKGCRKDVKHCACVPDLERIISDLQSANRELVEGLKKFTGNLRSNTNFDDSILIDVRLFEQAKQLIEKYGGSNE